MIVYSMVCLTNFNSHVYYGRDRTKITSCNENYIHCLTSVPLALTIFIYS